MSGTSAMVLIYKRVINCPSKGSFTYYVITKGEGWGFEMIMLT